ncbi:MAG TPA: hypothetical protein VFE15_00430 [Marmoricola sp.]|nr:hypothetical protein [Marmoricola sp.]
MSVIILLAALAVVVLAGIVVQSLTGVIVTSRSFARASGSRTLHALLELPWEFYLIFFGAGGLVYVVLHWLV